jgi:hypothetical protein
MLQRKPVQIAGPETRAIGTSELQQQMAIRADSGISVVHRPNNVLGLIWVKVN